MYKLLHLAVLSAIWIGSPAWACTCAPPPSVKDALAGADIVFEGSVRAVTQAAGVEKVQFDVHKAWKGLTSTHVELEAEPKGGLCGFKFKLNARYLVYADQTGPDAPVYKTTICTRTKLVKSAGRELRELNARKSKTGG